MTGRQDAKELTENPVIEALKRENQELKEILKWREQQLEQTKEQLEALIEAIPGSIAWIDADGVYLRVNQSLAASWDLSPEEFVGKPVGFLTGNEGLAQFVRNFITSPQTSARKVIFVDGKRDRRYYLMAIQKYQQGQATVSVGIDITEHKQTQEALKAQENFLQFVLDSIPQLIFWKDRNSVFQGCNRRWAKIFQFNHPDDIIGKTDYDLYPNATNVEIYIEKDRQVMESNKIKEFEEYKPDKDVWYNTQKIPIQDPDGRVVGILTTVEDITVRRKAEEALRIAEENYRSIYENALEGIFQSRPDGTYISVNPALAEIHGFDSPAEMLQTITNIGEQIYVNQEDRDRFKQIMAEKGKVTDFEYQAYQKEGTPIWLAESTRAVRDNRGNLLYYEGIVQDITQRKQEEERLQHQLQELRIEIDHQKRQQQVAEITQADYFQELQAQAQKMQFDDDDWF